MRGCVKHGMMGGTSNIEQGTLDIGVQIRDTNHAERATNLFDGNCGLGYYMVCRSVVFVRFVVGCMLRL